MTIKVWQLTFVIFAIGVIFLGVGRSIFSIISPNHGSAAPTGTWSSDACQAYKARVFQAPLVSSIAWYYDCEGTPVMQYPRAPAVLPAGVTLPPLPYKP